MLIVTFSTSKMNLIKFNKLKKKVWDQVEADTALGFPLVQDYKDYIERTQVGDVKTYIDGDPEGEEDYLETLRSVATIHVTAMKLQLGSKDKGKDEILSTSKQLLRGPFERRFRLVGFVIDCWERCHRSYIPWDFVVTEWNKANPYSPVVTKDTLERAYRRAVREDGIMIQLLIIKDSEHNESTSSININLRSEQERQILKALYDSDKEKGHEPILSLLYKHYVLTDKKEVSNRRRDILLSLAKRYREFAKTERSKPFN